MQQSNAGSFYRELPTDALLIDTLSRPTELNQTALFRELQRYRKLEALDMQYARFVAGSSTVSKEHQVWVLRSDNHTHMTQKQLQYLQDSALTELVRKRFMAAPGTVADMGHSLAEVVQGLNLQWQQFQLWGLHHVVESCECEVVLLLMANGYLRRDTDVRSLAIRLRRCPEMCIAFALCVGAFMCANQGLVTGATVTKANGLRQEEHKLSLLKFMRDAITQNQYQLYEFLEQCDSTDYVQRLSHINIIQSNHTIPDEPTRSTGGGVSVQVGDRQSDGGEINRLREEMDRRIRDANEELIRRTRDTRGDLETRIGNLQNEISRLRGDLEELANRIVGLHGQVQQMETDTITHQTQTGIQLRGLIASNETLRTQITQYRTEMADLNRQWATQLAHNTTILTTLRADIEHGRLVELNQTIQHLIAQATDHRLQALERGQVNLQAVRDAEAQAVANIRAAAHLQPTDQAALRAELDAIQARVAALEADNGLPARVAALEADNGLRGRVAALEAILRQMGVVDNRPAVAAQPTNTNPAPPVQGMPQQGARTAPLVPIPQPPDAANQLNNVRPL